MTPTSGRDRRPRSAGSDTQWARPSLGRDDILKRPAVSRSEAEAAQLHVFRHARTERRHGSTSCRRNGETTRGMVPQSARNGKSAIKKRRSYSHLRLALGSRPPLQPPPGGRAPSVRWRTVFGGRAPAVGWKRRLRTWPPPHCAAHPRPRFAATTCLWRTTTTGLCRYSDVLGERTRLGHRQLVFQQSSHVHFDRFMHVTRDLIAGLPGRDAAG